MQNMAENPTVVELCARAFYAIAGLRADPCGSSPAQLQAEWDNRECHESVRGAFLDAARKYLDSGG